MKTRICSSCIYCLRIVRCDNQMSLASMPRRLRWLLTMRIASKRCDSTPTSLWKTTQTIDCSAACGRRWGSFSIIEKSPCPTWPPSKGYIVYRVQMYYMGVSFCTLHFYKFCYSRALCSRGEVFWCVETCRGGGDLEFTGPCPQGQVVLFCRDLCAGAHGRCLSSARRSFGGF